MRSISLEAIGSHAFPPSRLHCNLDPVGWILSTSRGFHHVHVRSDFEIKWSDQTSSETRLLRSKDHRCRVQ